MIWRRGAGLGSSTIFKNLMSPTPRRKWYLTTGRRAHQMVLDPIPQSLPVHFFGSRPQPPTSHMACDMYVPNICYRICVINLACDIYVESSFYRICGIFRIQSVSCVVWHICLKYVLYNLCHMTCRMTCHKSVMNRLYTYMYIAQI